MSWTLIGAGCLNDRQHFASTNDSQSCDSVARSVKEDAVDDPVGPGSSAIRAIRDDSPSEDSDGQPQHAIQNRCRAAAVNTTSDCTDGSYAELVPDPRIVAADRSRTAAEKGRVVAASAVTS